MSGFRRYGELDEAVGGGDPMMEHVFDLSALDKQDASKHLFGQVDWDEYLRAGVFLSQSEFQLLERAQDNIDFAMGNATSAKALANLLLKLADKCTSSVPAQQYVFTRVEEILQCGGGEFKNRAALFTVDGTNIHDGPFLRALRASDSYIQKSASVGLATLLTAYTGEVNSLISWLCEMLQSDTQGATDIAIPALTVLMRREAVPGALFCQGRMNKLGRNGNAQHLYDLTFCLWTLSLDDNADIAAFLSSGSINILTDLVLAAPSRKVVRMAVATLLNLTAGQDEGVLTEMLTGGLTKVLENMIHANAHKQAGDVEVEHDVRNLFEVLMKNYRDFSTFDRWVSEAKTGNLRWGIVHTEKFWRENAKLLEENDFEMLKVLISLLVSESPIVVAVALYDLGGIYENPIVVAVALYDLGEFTRFYPNGRGVVKSLGGKDSAMELIGHSDQVIQRHALQCISKIMVTNWEFMK
eukprot:CAMPEP_0116991318 /NCGR_PEP_ID=MMETSP0467-20121206/66064_1 /TAXON_ID=283647 /ORGANISM="Mesodinium pulex, Strain SPMC105" /LENGTH=468 /DNA_ID=CAMNT_0004688373 /DNA_START=33 /DNA_END=1437 /DNA_ORIENTATION=+